MNGYELLLTPRRAGIGRESASELDLLIRVQAPASAPANRPQRRHGLNLAFVIDRSGSMSGQPLAEAKRCVCAMVEGLRPEDRAACVIYDDTVDVLVPSAPVRDPHLFRKRLAAVHEGGSTDLHAGWIAGAGQLADNLQAGSIARVILLSDGNANHGLTDPGTIEQQCAKLARAGVTTSTYGLGRSFNEDLMIGMARAGGGSHYYGQSAEDLIGPFRTEFELLQELCGRDVQVTVKSAAGVKARMLNEHHRMGPYTWRLPDVAFGSEAWAVLRLRIDGSAELGGDALQHLVSVEVELREAATDATVRLESRLEIPRLDDAALQALPEDEDVAARVVELESAALTLRIRHAAQQGEWEQVERLMAKAERLAATNPWVRESLVTLRRYAVQRDRERLSKEIAYSASRVSSRIMERGARDSSFDLVAEEGRASYLRRRTEQGKRQFDDER
jgi:Ca-activated chloride channel family protein